jgi:cytochrome c556
MKTKRIIEAALAAAIFAAAAGSVLAQAPADAVAKRQAIMKGMAPSIGAINTAAGAGDFATAQSKAAELAVNAKSLGTLFPPGSGTESGAKTRAKAEIWSDSAGFTAAYGKLTAATDGLVAATAAKDADKVKAAIGGLQQACGGCHTPYRGPPVP